MGMGRWCALWLVLTLLDALKGQTPNTKPVAGSVLQSFKEDQFQGEWFVIGLAGSTHRRSDKFLLNSFTATFERNENSRLQVSYAMTRGHRCITWSYVLIPAAQPGRFSVDGASGANPEEVQVYDTDYNVFALMLFRRQSGGQSILRVNLLCRMWIIQTRVLDKFVCLVRALGLSDNNIVFPDLAGNGPSGHRGLHPPSPPHGPPKPCGSQQGSVACFQGLPVGILPTQRVQPEPKVGVLIIPWSLCPPYPILGHLLPSKSPLLSWATSCLTRSPLPSWATCLPLVRLFTCR
ncbi:epididymal-specific lipocalin-12 [Vulpes lagopus]|uniref:epididymal-specific lipocalin-12 n=1 Tax=Vulpes lagopus TaxID=494514 RepID=UPI001BC8EE3C|nr:epididymal-specific lipocalin-12 [Vulpes lagopus]